jgi:hypothetical protein
MEGLLAVGGAGSPSVQQQVDGVHAAIFKVERELDEVKAVLRKKVQGTLRREEDPYGMTVEELNDLLKSLMRKQELLMDTASE